LRLFFTRANFSNFQVIKRPILIVVAQDKVFIDTVIMGSEGQIDGKPQPGWSEAGAIPVVLYDQHYYGVKVVQDSSMW
jgi:hypothetical protein